MSTDRVILHDCDFTSGKTTGTRIGAYNNASLMLNDVSLEREDGGVRDVPTLTDARWLNTWNTLANDVKNTQAVYLMGETAKYFSRFWHNRNNNYDMILYSGSLKYLRFYVDGEPFEGFNYRVYSSGRFASGTRYERDPAVVSDRSVVRSVTEDYVNNNSEPLQKTRKITKSVTKSRTVSAEQVFRALASAEVGVEIKFVTAGGKTEAEYTTTHNESESVESSYTVEEEMPITVPPHTTMRYTESAERVTSRQTLRATGVMDWKVHVDIYNLISITFESLEQMHLFFTGQLSDFPYGKVGMGDPRRLLYGYCKGETNVKPPGELKSTKRVPDEVKTCTQEVVLKTEDARSGVTSLEPLK